MPHPPNHLRPNFLKLKRMGIDTHQEAIVYMRADCHICRSEGFQAHARILVKTKTRSIIATLNVVYDHLLSTQEAGLSEVAWERLNPSDQEIAQFEHARAIDSLSDVRAKVYGQPLGQQALQNIIQDISAGLYADVHLASFITACAGEALDLNEITYLTQAMVDAGEKIDWGKAPIMDKHSVGGLPGNRTTPIIVAIIAASGLTMPKTSSRAITSPAGTADMMETLAPVDLSIRKMQEVVEKEGGCIVWGGAMRLSPADDILIRVERALDLDSEGQLIASVLSKKKAAGATHVILDMPVGITAKVRSSEAAIGLAGLFERVGQSIGLNIKTIFSDGSQPVGGGLGPALEAHDVLAVLRNHANAPRDLRERALILAGQLLEFSGKVPLGQGQGQAEVLLIEGKAWKKFQAICEAQGGLREPGYAPYTQEVEATRSGHIKVIDNRKLARVAKLAGAPGDKTAGLLLHGHVHDFVDQGQPLFSIHAESRGELAYAMEYVLNHPDIIILEESL